MRALRTALAVLAGCGACAGPSPQPAPPGPPPPAPPGDYAVYQELVLAQCMAPADGGVESVAAEHKSDRQPAWLACLYNGGTVSSCQVPCK